MTSTLVQRWLAGLNRFWFTVIAMTAAFLTYTCMYAFRKPFTAAGFQGIEYWGMDYKSILLIAQVLGYMLSKFIGIKVVSEMTPGNRGLSIVMLIGVAWLSLLGFALVAPPYNIAFLFINGLPLGMIWGLVFSFMEGRTVTEMLGAGLSTTFIISSGFVKTVGQMIMIHWGISQFWMPFVTGGLFFIPLVIFVWLLSQLPPPTAYDEAMRTHRAPMNAAERWAFFKKFAFSLSLLTVIYMFLTVYRDMRDNFMYEIWQTLGYGDQPLLFTSTELPIAVVVLVVLGSLMWIRDNRAALLANHYIILGGVCLIGLSTAGLQAGVVTPVTWMILVGTGLYMGYIPFNCIIFERFIATFKVVANAGFLIYVADAFGYLSSVAVIIFKNFSFASVSWYSFFIQTSYALAIIGGGLTVVSIVHFTRKRTA